MDIGLVEPPENGKSDRIQINLYDYPITYELNEKMSRKKLSYKILNDSEFQKELKERLGIRNYKRMLRELKKSFN